MEITNDGCGLATIATCSAEDLKALALACRWAAYHAEGSMPPDNECDWPLPERTARERAWFALAAAFDAHARLCEQA